MNLPHLFASPPSTLCARAASFCAAPAAGCGLLALAALLQAAGTAASPAAAAGDVRAQSDGAAAEPFSGQGQERHLAVHERRAEPGRYLGLQARAGQSATARSCQGFDKNTGFFTEQVGPLMKSPFKFAQHGQSRRLGLGDLSRRWPSTSTRWRSSTRASPRRTITRRRCSRSTPA